MKSVDLGNAVSAAYRAVQLNADGLGRQQHLAAAHMLSIAQAAENLLRVAQSVPMAPEPAALRRALSELRRHVTAQQMGMPGHDGPFITEPRVRLQTAYGVLERLQRVFESAGCGVVRQFAHAPSV
ncbi:MAG: hypothetical protein IT384_03500 [Deltaproteobacteria bacterium]|nr:hypothetical protein [Deltaproteobacteria bacterium]